MEARSSGQALAVARASLPIPIITTTIFITITQIHSYTGDLTLAARNYSMLVGNISAGEQWPPADQAAATAAFPWRLLVLARSTPRDTSTVDGMTATLQVGGQEYRSVVTRMCAW